MVCTCFLNFSGEESLRYKITAILYGVVTGNKDARSREIIYCNHV